MGKKAGKGALIQEEVSATLGVSQDQTLFQPIGVDLYNQCLTGDKATTVTTNQNATGAGPTVMLPKPIATIEGNGTRKSHRGSGISEGGVAYTLNSVERHAVAYAIENHPNDSRVGIDESGKVQTLTSRCGTGGGNVPLVMIDKEQCCEDNDGDIQRHRGV